MKEKYFLKEDDVMGDINIDAGLSVKADLAKLLVEGKGSYAKFKEDRRFNKDAYEALLEKYGKAVSDIEQLKTSIDELINQASANKLPSNEEAQSMETMAGLLGFKNPDGSLDLEKLKELGDKFGQNKTS